MNPFLQLAKILKGDEVQEGTVHRIAGQSALVSTRQGTATCLMVIATKIEVGDRVRIRNGNIVEKLGSTDGLKVYVV